MANLPELTEYTAGIYQLETEDPVLGGVNGIDNLQAKQLANRTNYLLAQVVLRATTDSPTLTGDPKAPTPAAADNDTSIATTAFVKTAIANLVNSSPAALDTLNELATALGNDANFAATMNTALALKAPLASPTFTGDPKAPTPTAGDNDTSIATTAFVQTALASKANLASPTFTGDPKAPTQTAGDNDTSIATTAFVQTAIAAKAGLAGPVFTGDPKAPTPPPGDNDTSLATTAFVQTAITNALFLDAGKVDFFARNTAPTGWLKANGALVSRTTYANLFTAIGTIFGAGDGSTTFALPDFRGEFIRGWDDARGIDAGRTLGSFQKASMLQFDGGGAAAVSALRTTSTAVGGVGHADFGLDYDNSTANYPNARSSYVSPPTDTNLVSNSAEGGFGFTRPRNIALLACIKF